MRAGERLDSFTIDDANEFHLGAEYLVPVKGRPAIRLGIWFDPDHSVHYAPTPANDLLDERIAIAFHPGAISGITRAEPWWPCIPGWTSALGIDYSEQSTARFGVGNHSFLTITALRHRVTEARRSRPAARIDVDAYLCDSCSASSPGCRGALFARRLQLCAYVWRDRFVFSLLERSKYGSAVALHVEKGRAEIGLRRVRNESRSGHADFFRRLLHAGLHPDGILHVLRRCLEVSRSYARTPSVNARVTSWAVAVRWSRPGDVVVAALRAAESSCFSFVISAVASADRLRSSWSCFCNNARSSGVVDCVGVVSAS